MQLQPPGSQQRWKKYVAEKTASLTSGIGKNRYPYVED
jgi:hypothetical protein